MGIDGFDLSSKGGAIMYFTKEAGMPEEISEKYPDYRGVVLPEGMSPSCLDELASLFVDYECGILVSQGEEAGPPQAAVMAFGVERVPSEKLLVATCPPC